MSSMTRREAVGISIVSGALAPQAPDQESIRRRLPPSVPPGVAAIIANTLRTDPGSHNTDWFGTLLMKGLLEWGREHVPEDGSFAKAWLARHAGSESVARFSGPRGRVIRVGGVPITTYCGHFGVAFPCFELFRQFKDERARRVCIELADVILHQTRRDRFGMVATDDFADYAIPDTCYFVVDPLMIASTLDSRHGDVYREQAVFQLRAYIDVFLNKETKLAKTMLLKDGIGKTYWTRASGWLLWSITGVLRHLPPQDRRFAGFVADLRTLAEGISRAQDPSGGLRLYLDDPKSPLETTGTAMCAMGVHESIRRGWLPASLKPFSARAWTYVKQFVTPDGKIRQAYSGWAVPAEKREIEFDKHDMGWIPGFILSTAWEMSR